MSQGGPISRDPVPEAAFQIHASAYGNVYMLDVAQHLCESLREAGRSAEVRVGELPVGRPGTLDLVVAPHEFFTLGPERFLRQARRQRSVCVAVNTEQPGTSWFRTASRHCRRCRLALDLNPAGTAALLAARVEALHFPLGYTRAVDRWGGRTAARKIDVAFLGALTPGRATDLAGLARELWSFRSEIRVFENCEPIGSEASWFLRWSERHELLARARLLLHLERGERPYFDWLRASEAIANGCTLITNSSALAHPLRAGEHYVSCQSDRLGEEIRHLLEDEERRQRMSRAAYAVLRDELSPSRRCGRVLASLDHLALARPGLRSRCFRWPSLPSISAGSQGGWRHVETPLRASATELESDPVARLARQFSRVTEAAKDQALGEIEFRRSLDRAVAKLALGSPERLEIERTAGFENCRPDVSVAVPLFNYEALVGEALVSILSSRHVSVEVLVVDDNSRDRSREVVRSFMQEHPEAAIELVWRRANHGLPAARNLAFRRARAPLVFLLDADNTVYPTALVRLKEALDGSDADFAYSIIEIFGERRELLSALPWWPNRLLQENYIDAMAMVRRDAWARVGGYNEDLALYGWEDYHFWLKIAQRGGRGALVPEILCRYRSQSTSMVSVTNLETSRLQAAFREQFAAIAGASSVRTTGR